jgi:flagellar biosynthesis protein FlhA
VDPEVANSIMKSVSKEMQKLMAKGFQPIVLCSPQLRRHFRRMVEQFAPSLTVLSHSELSNHISFQSLGKVEVRDAG